MLFYLAYFVPNKFIYIKKNNTEYYCYNLVELLFNLIQKIIIACFRDQIIVQTRPIQYRKF